MITLYNPTPKGITAKYDGGLYVFKPNERKEIYNTHAARHILERWKTYGLVEVTFDEKIAEQYIAPELYVHKKSIDGMIAYIHALHKRDDGFEIFENECGDRKSAERYDMQQRRKVTKEEIKFAENMLKDLEKVDTNSLVLEHANKLRAKAEELIAKANGLIPKKDVKDGKVTNDTTGSGTKGTQRP